MLRAPALWPELRTCDAGEVRCPVRRTDRCGAEDRQRRTEHADHLRPGPDDRRLLSAAGVCRDGLRSRRSHQERSEPRHRLTHRRQSIGSPGTGERHVPHEEKGAREAVRLSGGGGLVDELALRHAWDVPAVVRDQVLVPPALACHRARQDHETVLEVHVQVTGRRHRRNRRRGREIRELHPGCGTEQLRVDVELPDRVLHHRDLRLVRLHRDGRQDARVNAAHLTRGGESTYGRCDLGHRAPPEQPQPPAQQSSPCGHRPSASSWTSAAQPRARRPGHAGRSSPPAAWAARQRASPAWPAPATCAGQRADPGSPLSWWSPTSGECRRRSTRVRSRTRSHQARSRA